jgi:hypothetical protein
MNRIAVAELTSDAFAPIAAFGVRCSPHLSCIIDRIPGAGRGDWFEIIRLEGLVERPGGDRW